MSSVAAQDATAEYDCRTFGCTGVAKANRGKHAFKCDACIDKARAEPAAPKPRPLAAVLLDAAGEPLPAADADPARSLSDAAKALYDPAKKLERALGRRKAVREEAAQALAEFNASLRELRELAQSLIG